MPVRLLIPRIGVNAVIESVGETSNGQMAVPQRVQDVAWYAPGIVPGHPGDAVISGHLDWYTGPAVFQHLGSMHDGDTVTVQFADASSVTFDVTESTSYPVQAEPGYLFQAGGPAQLSLITCAGSWGGSQYTQRLVVNATTT
ncbi:MAG: class F sortase [Candidatus Dormiibacterota bacterium]